MSIWIKGVPISIFSWTCLGFLVGTFNDESLSSIPMIEVFFLAYAGMFSVLLMERKAGESFEDSYELGPAIGLATLFGWFLGTQIQMMLGNIIWLQVFAVATTVLSISLWIRSVEGFTSYGS
jgi:hypothetical protein